MSESLAAVMASEPHPWFRPVERRIGVIILCVAWLVFEFFQDEPLWLVLAAAATAYGVWEFFLGPAYRTTSKR